MQRLSHRASGSRAGTHSISVLGHVYVAGQTALSVSAQMGCELPDEAGGLVCGPSDRQRNWRRAG